MKILLLDSVANLGQAGEIVDVKDGYANNFLLPQGLAVVATKANTNEIKARQRAAQHRAEVALQTAREKGNALQGKLINLQVKSGDQGHLFGTVTNQDVADKLAERGIEVDKRAIQLAEEIKSLGRYEASVRLHPEVTVDFVLEVKSADEEA